MQACRTVPSVLLVHSASCKNHELCCDQACTQRTSINVHFQRRISRSHSSAGQSVRLITVRSAAQARVGPHYVQWHVQARPSLSPPHLAHGWSTVASVRAKGACSGRLCCSDASADDLASRSHSSAGQSVRPITVRSAVQARVGPKPEPRQSKIQKQTGTDER